MFCLGFILFFLVKDKINPVSSNHNHLKSNVLIIFAIVLLGILGISGGVGGPYFPSHFLFGIGFVILAYGLGIREKHFLVNKVIVFIGKISFSMYLIHFFVLDTIFIFFVDRLLEDLPNSVVLVVLFISTLLIATFLSYLLYRFIEQPGVKLGRKISAKMKAKKYNNNSEAQPLKKGFK